MANVGGFTQSPYAIVKFTNFDTPFTAAIIARDGITVRDLIVNQPRLRSGIFIYHGDTVVVTQDRPAFAGVPIYDLYDMANGVPTYDSTARWTLDGQKQIQFTYDIAPALAAYTNVQQSTTIASIAANLSSITYSPVTDHIYLVECNFGGTGIIRECQRDGTLIRNIQWAASGLTEDMEGLCWMEGDYFCGALERSQGGLQQKVLVFRIPAGTSNISLAIGQGGAGAEGDIIEKYTPAITTQSNLGFEGVAYDAANRLFYAVTERNSGSTGIGLVYRIARGGAAGNFTTQFDAQPCNTYGQTVGVQGTILNNATFPNNTNAQSQAQDASSLYYSALYNCFYVLTDEGECVFQCAPNGTVMSAIRTPAWASRCNNQGEGVTFTPDMQTMWIVGEPSNFSRWSLTSPEDHSAAALRQVRFSM